MARGFDGIAAGQLLACRNPEGERVLVTVRGFSVDSGGMVRAKVSEDSGRQFSLADADEYVAVLMTEGHRPIRWRGNK